MVYDDQAVQRCGVQCVCQVCRAVHGHPWPCSSGSERLDAACTACSSCPLHPRHCLRAWHLCGGTGSNCSSVSSAPDPLLSTTASWTQRQLRNVRPATAALAYLVCEQRSTCAFAGLDCVTWQRERVVRASTRKNGVQCSHVVAAPEQHRSRGEIRQQWGSFRQSKDHHTAKPCPTMNCMGCTCRKRSLSTGDHAYERLYAVTTTHESLRCGFELSNSFQTNGVVKSCQPSGDSSHNSVRGGEADLIQAAARGTTG
jgi:hypothetical protein